ncbi:uncharacterized protein K489DRAFT_373938 [Dissoconium aciculare CBS 342.82]|uniref:Uncharacterized protein n=1 Tax=Dissoconium aciculare CBS 342.82 TaxID=1314786 RepID=A0A6J3LWE0_9PEZI|nr:uncharacterized protein K489DRAFT_373938 [Dissoconium aciculare CBS 342.82]KAF1818957.1 hypothetical protein K489DRAFT_373938 [Dissoconium aciculare CBS 342.82]
MFGTNSLASSSGKPKRKCLPASTRRPATLPPTPQSPPDEEGHTIDETVPLLKHHHRSNQALQAPSKPKNHPWRNRLRPRKATAATSTTAIFPTHATDQTRLSFFSRTPQADTQDHDRVHLIKPSLCSLHLCIVHATLTSTAAFPQKTKFYRAWITKPSTIVAEAELGASY